jgi:alkanesulfonate monooxygenase SsuD/methylene tetrahydromethanopterin reductase-like flavin-dependent oxidoreductase (luciferase family)
MLARLAAEAEGMYVGVGVLLASLANPIELLEMATTMDAITDGRFVLGLGLGYRAVEFDAFGVPRGKRAAYLEEAIDLLPRLWTGKEVRHRSERVVLDGVTFVTQTKRRPHPPIWLAANNDVAVARAARHPEAWFLNPHAKLEVLERQMGIYRDTRAVAGLGPPEVVPILKEVLVAESAEEAWRDARPFLEEKYRVYVEWGQDRVMAKEDALNVPFDELQTDRFIVGDPDQVIRQLEDYRSRLGVNHFAFRLQWAGEKGSLDQDKVLRSIRLIGRHVIPHFSKAEGTGPALT